MSDMTVAKTILQQLGGNRFLVMTGAKNLVGSENSLAMKINGRNGAGKKVSHVRITLTPEDTYTVETMNVYGSKVTTVNTRLNVYCDSLRESFESLTGLYTSF